MTDSRGWECCETGPFHYSCNFVVNIAYGNPVVSSWLGLTVDSTEFKLKIYSTRAEVETAVSFFLLINCLINALFYSYL